MSNEPKYPIDENIINEFPLNGPEIPEVEEEQEETIKTVEFNGAGNQTAEGSKFAWDFGDPENSTIDNPNIKVVHEVGTVVEHTYFLTGKYVVRLIELRKDEIQIETVKSIRITV